MAGESWIESLKVFCIFLALGNFPKHSRGIFFTDRISKYDINTEIFAEHGHFMRAHVMCQKQIDEIRTFLISVNSIVNLSAVKTLTGHKLTETRKIFIN